MTSAVVGNPRVGKASQLLYIPGPSLLKASRQNRPNMTHQPGTHSTAIQNCGHGSVALHTNGCESCENGPRSREECAINPFSRWGLCLRRRRLAAVLLSPCKEKERVNSATHFWIEEHAVNRRYHKAFQRSLSLLLGGVVVQIN